MNHYLGTTFEGHDVLSKVLIGARPTILAGLLGGFLIVAIGTSIGITAGYVGGTTENLLMRFVDFVYGIPTLPFAIVIIAFFGADFFKSVVVIGLILWRSPARVIRSQVLSIKEREYVKVARTIGGGNFHIIKKHILPNIMAMAVLYFSLGIGYTIIVQAGLSFLGVIDPFTPSWAIMIRNAFNAGAMVSAWWWGLTPSLLLAGTVLSTFMFGREYEKVAEVDSDV